MESEPTTTSRRNFLKKSGGLAIGASIVGPLTFPRSVHAGASETLRIGLIGCGSRGTAAAANALAASNDNLLVAMGDAFPDAANKSREQLRGMANIGGRVRVDDESLHSGFDAYQHVIDSGVDVVILAEPPHFRPRSLAYAIDQGKHCFVEKPIAVDAPGVQSVVESCAQAKAKNLSVVSGLCWRYHPAVQETIRRIVEDGAIGDIIAIQSNYNSQALWHRGDRPEWSRMEYQIRNWLYFPWLSGDIIAEQAVHSLDKCAWLLGDIHPIKASGMGGRQQRTDPKYGSVYDHFAVAYEFPDGVHAYFTCRQQDGCTNHVDELVLGTKGQARILAHQIEGPNAWHYSGPEVEMYELEHQALFRSIREGTPINDGHYMTNSSMIGLMGRMSSYTGQELTWEQCTNSQERLGPNEYSWTDDVPASEIAVPGIARFT